MGAEWLTGRSSGSNMLPASMLLVDYLQTHPSYGLSIGINIIDLK